MFSNPFRVLVVVACAFALFVGSSIALADLRKFTPKERRKFDRIVFKETQRERKRLESVERGFLREVKSLRKDARKGRVSREELREQLEELCVELERFRLPIAPTKIIDGSLRTFNDDEVKAKRIQQIAVGKALGVGPLDGDVVLVLATLGDSMVRNITSGLNDLREELAVKVDAEKRRLDEELAQGERIPEKFVFRRNIETHEVQPLDGGDPQVFVRPGIRRIEVTEDGNAKVMLAVAFDEPDSFVRIELKKPDGTVLSTFDAQQKDSTNGESRQLAFEFTLDTLPAAGEPVLFTTSSSFDQSLLSLVDPFDCLAFLFPGFVTPSTPPTPSTAKPE